MVDTKKRLNLYSILSSIFHSQFHFVCCIHIGEFTSSFNLISFFVQIFPTTAFIFNSKWKQRVAEKNKKTNKKCVEKKCKFWNSCSSVNFELLTIPATLIICRSDFLLRGCCISFFIELNQVNIYGTFSLRNKHWIIFVWPPKWQRFFLQFCWTWTNSDAKHIALNWACVRPSIRTDNAKSTTRISKKGEINKMIMEVKFFSSFCFWFLVFFFFQKSKYNSKDYDDCVLIFCVWWWL